MGSFSLASTTRHSRDSFSRCLFVRGKKAWHFFINYFLLVQWSHEWNYVKTFFKTSLDLKYKEWLSTQETHQTSNGRKNTMSERRGQFYCWFMEIKLHVVSSFFSLFYFALSFIRTADKLNIHIESDKNWALVLGFVAGRINLPRNVVTLAPASVLGMLLERCALC